jgi:hypothetical protein
MLDSVVDLAWYNDAATQSSSFTDLRIDWDGSLGSDHAMSRTDSACLVFTGYHVKDTKPCYLI